ncbi:MAG TPA: SGNH/GDSL hydrolase family protein [Prosthecobacter sp.]|nr:SGNH/GDSL hydrolase family protein [Prosthecobacter sp.]
MKALLVFLTFFACQAFAAGPDKTRQFLTEAKEPVRIVCIGDSITGVYYHSGSVRAYPEMLQIALQKLHPRATISVRNAGISGDTSKGGLFRLKRDVLDLKPHLVTIMFGMNDLVRVPLAEFVRNMQAIIKNCRDAGAEVVLCTQNSIVDSPQRPAKRLADFSQAIRDLARTSGLGLADCHAAFESVRAKDELEWNLLLSDAIHPNMDGHKLFAETIAQTITGKDMSLRDVGPPPNPLTHTLKLLAEGKPVAVFAMPPFGQHIAPALKSLYPNAQVTVKPWPVEGKTLAELENTAKAVRTMKPNLVLIAVPGHLSEKTPQAFHQRYSWIMNWSLSFGPQEWDVVVALPSAAKPAQNAEEQANEELARRLVKAQDLSFIGRSPGDGSALPDLLAKWITAHKP